MKPQADVRWALFYFMIAAVFGAILRLAYVFPLPIVYTFVRHAHSHVALLGWVYVALQALLNKAFLRPEAYAKYKYIRLFTNISVCGMMLSFPFEGYAAVSIAFSTMFVFGSYAYGVFLLSHVRPSVQHTTGFALVRLSVWFLFLSTLGVWALPVVITQLGKASVWYQASVYFFLHFQYNGWILTGLLALFCDFFKVQNNRLFWGIAWGVLGTLGLSWVGFFSQEWIFFVGRISATAWLFSLFFLWRGISEKGVKISPLGQLFLGLFFLKTFLIFLSAFPFISEKILFNTDVIISYLHFTFLGVIASGIYFFLRQQNLFGLPKTALIAYALSFLATELLITYKGLCIMFDLPLFSAYALCLALCSLPFALIAMYAFGISLVKKSAVEK